MAPKRELSPLLPGNNRFGSDYSDERRAVLVRSDDARKRDARKYSNYGLPVPQSLLAREVPEFDRLRWECELELRRRQRMRNGGEGASSSTVPAESSAASSSSAPPPEYEPARYGRSITLDDYVREEDIDEAVAVVAAQTAHGCGVFAAPPDFVREEEIDETVEAVKLRTAQEAAMVVVLDSDEE